MPAACWYCKGLHDPKECPQVIEQLPYTRELYAKGFRQTSRKYRMVAKADGQHESWSEAEFCRRVYPTDIHVLTAVQFEAFRQVVAMHINPCSQTTEGICVGQGTD